MGAPAERSPQDRAATRELAAAVIASVEADARHPLAPGDHGTLIDCEEDEIEMAMLGMAQEIAELVKERDRREAAIWAVIDMFDGAVANVDSHGKGGQHVSYHGDFASMPPGAAGQMRRWSRDLRSALRDEWPMTREEFVALYPGTPTDALDHMFKTRKP